MLGIKGDRGYGLIWISLINNWYLLFGVFVTFWSNLHFYCAKC
jgi:hypothetical protein